MFQFIHLTVGGQRTDDLLLLSELSNNLVFSHNYLLTAGDIMAVIVIGHQLSAINLVLEPRIIEYKC